MTVGSAVGYEGGKMYYIETLISAADVGHV